MIERVTGTLLVCEDPAIKQFVISLDVGEKGDSFILEDLDEIHLLVDSREVTRIKRELKALLDKNTFEPLE